MSLNPGIVNDVNYYDFETYVFPQLTSYGIDSISSCCSYDSGNQQENMNIWILCCPSQMDAYYSQNTIFNQSNMAYFSSRGPTSDGRIKPDVAGPGLTVASMHSDGDTTTFQCQDIRPAGNNSAALLTMQGTSMATPGVAGAAALVRQYYKTFGGMSNPTGYLVKATLIHSGQNMIGDVYVNGLIQNLPPTPNVYNGFGLVSLGTTLAFSNSQFQLFAYDRQNASNGEETTYCFMSTSAMPEFKATITWYDPPGPLGTSNILVNNLDLYVGVSSNPNASGVTYYGNGNIKGDTTNNVEVANAPNIPASNYYISVLVAGKSVTISPQKFALIVTGNIKQVSSCPPVNVTFVPPPSPSPSPSSPPIYISQSVRQYPLFIVSMAVISLSLVIAFYSF
jgi:subtilisin family serine protease